MVQTRKQADAEAQAANSTLPARITNPAPSTPAPALPSKGGTNKPGSKKKAAKKATSEKPSRESSSRRDNGISRSTTSGNEVDSNNDDTAPYGQVANKTKTPAPKKGRMKKTAEEIVEAQSNGDNIEDNDSAELAKIKGKAEPKTTRTLRAMKSDTAGNDDTPGTGELPKKTTTAKTRLKSPPRNVTSENVTDPDETETEEDLDQKLKAYEERKHKQAATKRKAPSVDAAEGQLSAEPSVKKTKRVVARHAAAEKDGLNDEPREGIPSGGRSKRAAAATKREAPSIDATEGQQTEPPKKKTKRSVATHAAIDEDGPHHEPPEGTPSGGRSKRVAAATRKAAKAPKPQAKREVGTRRSARISDNLVVSSYEADYNMERRPVKTRFRKRAMTPEMPKNNIGLDENEIFSPRFPTEKPKPAKVTKRTRNGDRVSTNTEQRTLTREANRTTFTPWEQTTVTRLTERLIVRTEARIGAGPTLVGDPLPVRFERRSLDNSGYGIAELGTQDSEAQTPTLTSEIHPIWASRNFTFSKGPSEKHRAYNERAYRAISPALRLASHWIDEPEFEEFWHALCLGALSQNKKTGAVRIHGRGPGGVYGETPFHALNIARSEESAKEKTASLMQELAELESLEWRFEPTRLKYVGLSETEGQVSALHDWFERDILYDSRPPPTSSRTTSERLRVLFIFAVHLCRELVQQVYHHMWARDFEDTPPPRISEVFFEVADGASEFLEVSWDAFMFTGSIVKINPHKFVQVECPDGLSIALGRRAAEWKGPASPKTFAAIPMGWLNDLFQDTFWSQKGSSSYFPRLPNGDPPYCAAGPFT